MWKIEKAITGKGYVIMNEIGLVMGRQYSKADCKYLIDMMTPSTDDYTSDTLEGTFGAAWPYVKDTFEKYAEPRCLCGCEGSI